MDPSLCYVRISDKFLIVTTWLKLLKTQDFHPMGILTLWQSFCLIFSCPLVRGIPHHEAGNLETLRAPSQTGTLIFPGFQLCGREPESLGVLGWRAGCMIRLSWSHGPWKLWDPWHQGSPLGRSTLELWTLKAWVPQKLARWAGRKPGRVLSKSSLWLGKSLLKPIYFCETFRFQPSGRVR